MFNFHDFIFAGIKGAIGKQPDYWVILNSAAWNEKGVLTQDDLAAVSAMIVAKNTPPEPEVLEEVPADEQQNDAL